MSGGLMSGGLMSGGLMSGGLMSGGLMSGGLMSGGLMSAHRNSGLVGVADGWLRAAARTGQLSGSII